MKKITVFVGFVVALCVLIQCNTQTSTATYTPPKPSGLSGEELAKQHCGSCHQYPTPDLAEQRIWEKSILPKMALRLGMADKMTYFTSLEYEDMMMLSVANIFPDNPVMATEDWQKIIDFYVKNAPEKPIPQGKKVRPTVGLANFEAHSIYTTGEIPLVTMVKFRPEQKSLYVAYRGHNHVDIFDNHLSKTDSFPTQSPVSDMVFLPNKSLLALNMGIMDPNEQRRGTLIKRDFLKKETILMDTLRRPVEITLADLNQDGKQDAVICQFGNEIGKLAWYENNFKTEHVLKYAPGARNAIVQDINGDNLPDITVLMTQARESVILFINKGNGRFEEKPVLFFSPIYGSSHIQLVDFDKDGFQDILYTNGDNADLSMSLKRFHGVHIFLNDGKQHFTEKYFYPMFGASKAMAADFDLDGDLDIAAISFFTDAQQMPNEGFLYFENLGNWQFKPSTLKETAKGKWMVMDVADTDQDGDADIVLGSFMLKERNVTDNKQKARKVSVLVLENKTK
ncbi:FG-GAP repeat domain-containing protein [Flectobacillus major]|jgi:hypothetical protein|uniref:FG-GAP repeat domain-containing protein n=1 Tax=Flectobacillus major TaxID=103 RepID=UPI0004245B99|nr:VCBS repeat-containing protein [Flectobacillus major]